MENAIADRVDEDFFRDEFTADTTEWQAEYTLQNSTATQEWVKKITKVEYLEWHDSYYRSLPEWSSVGGNMSDEQLSTGACKFYNFKNWSVFLYPSPVESVNNWLKVQAVVNLIDLVENWAETTIFPHHSELRQYHRIIWLWAIPMIHMNRNIWEKNDIVNARELFQTEMSKMVGELNAKNLRPVEWVLPKHNFY